MFMLIIGRRLLLVVRMDGSWSVVVVVIWTLVLVPAIFVIFAFVSNKPV